MLTDVCKACRERHFLKPEEVLARLRDGNAEARAAAVRELARLAEFWNTTGSSTSLAAAPATGYSIITVQRVKPAFADKHYFGTDKDRDPGEGGGQGNVFDSKYNSRHDRRCTCANDAPAYL
jgi:hypothetical protein